jgi:hypothetical protein
MDELARSFLILVVGIASVACIFVGIRIIRFPSMTWRKMVDARRCARSCNELQVETEKAKEFLGQGILRKELLRSGSRMYSRLSLSDDFIEALLS